MKKLGKLNINPEKMIKEGELLMLKGGEYGTGCDCKCYTWDWQYVDSIPWAGPLDCNPLCLYVVYHGIGVC